MREMLEHSDIGWIERTGYPYWMQDDDNDNRQEPDEDALYEERRDRERYGRE